MIENIWEGIYADFSEVNKSGDGFCSRYWIDNSFKKINDLLNKINNKENSKSLIGFRENLLPLIVAMAKKKSSKIKILDFGGGIGTTYVEIIASNVNCKNIEYHIVDNSKICEAGEKVFNDDNNIHFHSSLPDELEKVDIVHICSSLQYIEDWKGLMVRLSEYKQRYFYLTDLLAGEIPTFASVQNYYNSKIPVWFFNRNEIEKLMLTLNYNLLFESAFIATILGDEQEIPQNNFPEEYRLGHSCSLLFG